MAYSVKFNINLVRLGLSESDVDHIHTEAGSLLVITAKRPNRDPAHSFSGLKAEISGLKS